MHENLYKGEIIELGLTNNWTEFVCKNNNDHTVSHVTKFTRKIEC